MAEKASWVQVAKDDWASLNHRLARLFDILQTNQDLSVRALNTSQTLRLLRPWSFITSDTTSGSVTLTLPPLVQCIGCYVNVKKMAAANTLTLDGNGALIDGAGTLAWTTDKQSFSLINDANGWNIV